MSLFLKIRSFLNSIFYFIRRHVHLSRSNYSEVSARALNDLQPETKNEIEKLSKQYQIKFEDTLNRGNSLENYHLLHLLGTVQKKWNWILPQNKNVCDVGSKNFYYAKTLEIFFKPQSLTGIELDAFVLYDDLHTRKSYAEFYLKQIGRSRYLPINFLNFSEKTDIITLFYPFVISEPLIRWGLPLSEFKPELFFKHVAQTLNANGQVLIINQGDEEWIAVQKLAKNAGLILKASYTASQTLLYRKLTPMVSLWTLP
ncbi:hypothetical protein K1X76_04475 [bacterium]|nr:hypothetical protein [bacterium]